MRACRRLPAYASYVRCLVPRAVCRRRRRGESARGRGGGVTGRVCVAWRRAPGVCDGGVAAVQTGVLCQHGRPDWTLEDGGLNPGTHHLDTVSHTKYAAGAPPARRRPRAQHGTYNCLPGAVGENGGAVLIAVPATLRMARGGGHTSFDLHSQFHHGRLSGCLLKPAAVHWPRCGTCRVPEHRAPCSRPDSPGAARHGRVSKAVEARMVTDPR